MGRVSSWGERGGKKIRGREDEMDEHVRWVGRVRVKKGERGVKVRGRKVSRDRKGIGR